MNKRVKKLWLIDLRSGKYKQGRHELVIEGETNKYCCLGVLQDIYYLERGQSFPKKFFSEGVCHKRVEKWADIDNEIMEGLGNRNDGNREWKREHSFKQIANYIEKHL